MLEILPEYMFPHQIKLSTNTFHAIVCLIKFAVEIWSVIKKLYEANVLMSHEAHTKAPDGLVMSKELFFTGGYSRALRSINKWAVSMEAVLIHRRHRLSRSSVRDWKGSGGLSEAWQIGSRFSQRFVRVAQTKTGWLEWKRQRLIDPRTVHQLAICERFAELATEKNVAKIFFVCRETLKLKGAI